MTAASASRAAAGPTLIGAAEIAAGAGHDTNMFLQVALDPAQRGAPVGGWFMRAAPRLTGALVTGGGWRVDAAYQLDYRHGETAGGMLHHEVELSVAPPRLGALALSLGAAAGRFDPRSFTADRFVFAGGEVGLRLELDASWRAAGSYRAEARRYPDPARADTDLVHLAELALAYRPAGPSGAWSAGFTPLRAAAVSDPAVRAVRAGPQVELVRGRLALELGAWGGGLEVGGSSGRHWQLGGTAVALVRLARSLDLAASFELNASPWSAAAVRPEHERRYVMLSLVGHATGRRAPAAARQPDTSLRPLVEGGRVRFRLRADRAAVVQVIGSWNDWQTPGRALEWRGELSLWQVSLPLPPGAHRYRFVVDGRAVRPPDALRYATDDFGDSDGVVEVSAPE